MQYAGGKARLGRKIEAIIEQYREPGQLYVEPFVGGCSVFCQVDNPRLGGDLNKYVVSMWQALLRGWRPDYVTEEQYNAIKADFDLFPPELVGFAMVACSFGGNFADVYARGEGGCDYFDMGLRSALRKAVKMRGATIIEGDYRQFSDVRGAVIYCDPPYSGTAQKYAAGGFDSAAFWDWCRKMSAENVVLVSEYGAPVDVKQVASWQITKNIRAGSTEHQVTERLFLVGDHVPHRGQLDLFKREVCLC